jgi:hypothetical protein
MGSAAAAGALMGPFLRAASHQLVRNAALSLRKRTRLDVVCLLWTAKGQTCPSRSCNRWGNAAADQYDQAQPQHMPWPEKLHSGTQST